MYLNQNKDNVIFSFRELTSRTTASKLRRIMSAVGTTLLHSPGCNEGKARNETLGIYEWKVISSSAGAALTARVLGHLLWSCAAPTGLNKCGERLTQGLRPGLCRSIALTGLIYISPKLLSFIILMRLPPKSTAFLIPLGGFKHMRTYV